MPFSLEVASTRTRADELDLTFREEVAAIDHLQSWGQVTMSPCNATAVPFNALLCLGVRGRSPHSNTQLQIMAEMICSTKDTAGAPPSEALLHVAAMLEIGGEESLDHVDTSH